MNGFRSQSYRFADFSLAPDVAVASERQDAGQPRARARFRLTTNACYGIALIFLLVGVLIYLWPRLQMVKQVYHYQALLSQYKTLSEEQRRLKIDLGTLQSLSRIDRVAREQLGMVFPESSQFVLVPLSPRESSKGEDPGVQNSRP